MLDWLRFLHFAHAPCINTNLFHQSSRCCRVRNFFLSRPHAAFSAGQRGELEADAKENIL